MMGDFYLELTTGEQSGVCFNISGESAVIGRADNCDIHLENVRGVSRNHCRVMNDERGLRVMDLGSQNGVYVGGKKVREAIIGAGVSFQVGEAIFMVHQLTDGALAMAGSAELAAGATGAGNELGEVRGAMPLGAAAGTAGGMIKAPGSMDSAVEGGKNVLLQLLVLVVLVFGGLYLLQLVAQPVWFNHVFALVKAHQPKAVNFGMYFDRYEILGKDGHKQEVIRAADYRGMLLPSLQRLESNPNVPKRRMLVITGVREGEAKLVLQNKSATPIGTFRIVCRGVTPYVIPPDISRDDARQMGDSALAQARRFASDNKEYDAWVKYQLAADLFNGAGQDVEKGGNAAVEALNYKRKLSEKVGAIFDEAMAAAFPSQSRVRKSNFKNALVLLEEARNLIPDDESIDRQVIENWMMMINGFDKRKRK